MKRNKLDYNPSTSKKTEKPNLTIYFGIIMATYSLGFVAMSAFSSFYLLGIGLSNSTVGILLAVGSLLAVFLEPVVGALIDRHSKVSTKYVLLILSGLMAVIGPVFILLSGKNLTVSTLLYGFCIMLLMLAQPILKTLGMDTLNSAYGLNYGVGAAMGSLGYAAGSYGFGILSVKFGVPSIPVIFSIAFFILSVGLFFYPVKKMPVPPGAHGTAFQTPDTQSGAHGTASQPSEAPSARTKIGNPYLFLANYKKYAIMLIGLTLIYFSHTVINTFSLQIITPKGGTSADMGTAAAIAAVCELTTTLLFSFYMRKFKLSTLIKISSIFFILKTLFSLLTKSVMTFFLIQGFQTFGWGLMAIGIVYYVDRLANDNDKAQAQAYAGMAGTIANVIATAIGGKMIDAFGVDMFVLIGTIAAGIGAIIIWITCEEQTSKTIEGETNEFKN